MRDYSGRFFANLHRKCIKYIITIATLLCIATYMVMFLNIISFAIGVFLIFSNLLVASMIIMVIKLIKNTDVCETAISLINKNAKKILKDNASKKQHITQHQINATYLSIISDQRVPLISGILFTTMIGLLFFEVLPLMCVILATEVMVFINVIHVTTNKIIAKQNDGQTTDFNAETLQLEASHESVTNSVSKLTKKSKARKSRKTSKSDNTSFAKPDILKNSAKKTAHPVKPNTRTNKRKKISN